MPFAWFRNFPSWSCEFRRISEARSIYFQERSREGWDTGHLRGAYVDGSRVKEVCVSLYFSKETHSICFLITENIFYFMNGCRWNSSNPWSDFSPVSVAWTVDVEQVLNYVCEILMRSSWLSSHNLCIFC